MKKSELKNGQIVKLRNKEIYIIIGDQLCSRDGFVYFKSYDEELKNINNKSFDIIEVHELKYTNYLGAYNRFIDNKIISSIKLLWKREDIPVINWKEVKINEPIKIVDKNGDYIIRHFAGINDGKIEVILDGRTTYTSISKNFAENLVVDFSHLELVEK